MGGVSIRVALRCMPYNNTHSCTTTFTHPTTTYTHPTTTYTPPRPSPCVTYPSPLSSEYTACTAPTPMTAVQASVQPAQVSLPPLVVRVRMVVVGGGFHTPPLLLGCFRTPRECLQWQSEGPSIGGVPVGDGWWGGVTSDRVVGDTMTTQQHNSKGADTQHNKGYVMCYTHTRTHRHTHTHIHVHASYTPICPYTYRACSCQHCQCACLS